MKRLSLDHSLSWCFSASAGAGVLRQAAHHQRQLERTQDGANLHPAPARVRAFALAVCEAWARRRFAPSPPASHWGHSRRLWMTRAGKRAADSHAKSLQPTWRPAVGRFSVGCPATPPALTTIVPHFKPGPLHLRSFELGLGRDSSSDGCDGPLPVLGSSKVRIKPHSFLASKRAEKTSLVSTVGFGRTCVLTNVWGGVWGRCCAPPVKTYHEVRGKFPARDAPVIKQPGKTATHPPHCAQGLRSQALCTRGSVVPVRVGCARRTIKEFVC